MTAMAAQPLVTVASRWPVAARVAPYLAHRSWLLDSPCAASPATPVAI